MVGGQARHCGHGRVKKRVLYTTNTMTSIWSIAWVILTSRTPHFRRDDMPERLLLRTRRLESFHCLAELDRRTVEQRAVLMTNLHHDLIGVTSAMRDHGADDISGDVRMADFYAFAVRVAQHRGEEDEVKEAFQRLQRAQVGFAGEGDPIAALLEIWLRTASNAGRWIRGGGAVRGALRARRAAQAADAGGHGGAEFLPSLGAFPGGPAGAFRYPGSVAEEHRRIQLPAPRGGGGGHLGQWPPPCSGRRHAGRVERWEGGKIGWKNGAGFFRRPGETVFSLRLQLFAVVFFVDRFPPFHLEPQRVPVRCSGWVETLWNWGGAAAPLHPGRMSCLRPRGAGQATPWRPPT